MSQPRISEHDIHPLFLQRWSPRAFSGEAIDEATLLRFFEAARWAPSGYNAQPWRFLYARRDTPEWQPVFAALSEYNQGWATRASALVVILSRKVWTPPGKTEPQAITTHSFDAGAAWANLALQVTLSGWHAHGIGGFDKGAMRWTCRRTMPSRQWSPSASRATRRSSPRHCRRASIPTSATRSTSW